MNEVGRSKAHSWLVNGALVVIALLSLAPLAWMVSVSFMPRGEASHFPPPFLPSQVTLDNYRELFGRSGMGRNLANSLLQAPDALDRREAQQQYYLQSLPFLRSLALVQPDPVRVLCVLGFHEQEQRQVCGEARAVCVREVRADMVHFVQVRGRERVPAADHAGLLAGMLGVDGTVVAITRGAE